MQLAKLTTFRISPSVLALHLAWRRCGALPLEGSAIRPYLRPPRLQINLSDPLCQAALRRYASRLAAFRTTRRPVRLGLRIPSDDPPRSPTELGQLEAAHAVCDLYLWLACRFPREFTDGPSAVSCAELAQRLIGEGIRLMGVKALREGQRMRRANSISSRGARKRVGASRRITGRRQ